MDQLCPGKQNTKPLYCFFTTSTIKSEDYIAIANC